MYKLILFSVLRRLRYPAIIYGNSIIPYVGMPLRNLLSSQEHHGGEVLVHEHRVAGRDDGAQGPDLAHPGGGLPPAPHRTAVPQPRILSRVPPRFYERSGRTLSVAATL
jgi:hypothetical protein